MSDDQDQAAYVRAPAVETLVAAALRADGWEHAAVEAAREGGRSALGQLAAAETERVAFVRTDFIAERERALRNRSLIATIVGWAIWTGSWAVADHILSDPNGGAAAVLRLLGLVAAVVWIVGLVGILGARTWVRRRTWPALVRRACRWIRFAAEQPEQFAQAKVIRGGAEHDRKVEILAFLRTQRAPIDRQHPLLAAYVSALAADEQMRRQCVEVRDAAQDQQDPNERLILTTIAMQLCAENPRLAPVHRKMALVDRAPILRLLGVTFAALVAGAILLATLASPLAPALAVTAAVALGVAGMAYFPLLLSPPVPRDADQYLAAALNVTDPDLRN